MTRFIFPQWTETLKRWNGLLAIGAPIYLVALIAYGVTPEAIRIGYQPDSDTDYCPTTAYGASKALGEEAVRAAQLDVPWVIVRPTSIWGPWFDIPYRTFFDSIQHGRFFRIDSAPGSVRLHSGSPRSRGPA